MWVQLTTIKHIEIKGVLKTFYPGDYANVGKQQAMLWISNNEARTPTGGAYATSAFVGGAVVMARDLIRAQSSFAAHSGIVYEEYPTTRQMVINFDKVVFYDNGNFSIRPEFIPMGLGLLDTWEIAVPLMEYKTLAQNIGTQEERDKAQKVLRDLRIPVYDTRLIFAKNTSNTERLFNAWNAIDGDRNLAFLQALYRTPLLILALPITWTGQHVQ